MFQVRGRWWIWYASFSKEDALHARGATTNGELGQERNS